MIQAYIDLNLHGDHTPVTQNKHLLLSVLAVKCTVAAKVSFLQPVSCSRPAFALYFKTKPCVHFHTAILVKMTAFDTTGVARECRCDNVLRLKVVNSARMDKLLCKRVTFFGGGLFFLFLQSYETQHL